MVPLLMFCLKVEPCLIFQDSRGNGGGWGKWGMFAAGVATSAVAVAAARIAAGGEGDFVANAAKPIDLFDDEDTTDFKR